MSLDDTLLEIVPGRSLTHGYTRNCPMVISTQQYVDSGIPFHCKGKGRAGFKVELLKN